MSCVIVVYDVPWRGTRKVTEATCNPVETEPVETLPVKRTRREPVGGYSEQDPSDQKYKEIADFAVAQMDETSGDRHVRAVEEVESAATQVRAQVW